MDRKQLRKAMSPAGWIMLVYYLIMTVSMVVGMLVEMIVMMTGALVSGNAENAYSAMMGASESAWGAFLAAGVGIGILLLWKKSKFWKEEIWAKGKPMTPGAFFGLLSIFLSAQIVYQLFAMALELLLNGMGLTMLEGMETLSAGGGSFSMFLYMCVLAPVAEELLCRGLVQRTLLPYGKKLAILGSAFLFGMMHGNVLQTPFAFLVGLVLGYVAAEYSIAWAMVLHMVNNLVLGDLLTRLSAGMGDLGAALLLWGILLLCAIGAIITLVRRRREVRAWMHSNIMGPTYARCFFTSAGVVTFTVVMLLSIIGTMFILVTPL